MGEWKKITLHDLTSFVIGGDWGGSPKEAIENSTLAYCIRGSEIKEWNRNKGKTAVIRRIKNSSLESRKLDIGNILLEISGGGPEQPVGRVLYIDEDALNTEDYLPLVCTNFFRKLQLVDSVYNKYVYYYLHYFYISGNTIGLQGGSNNLRNLKYKDYQMTKIPLPPFEEQKQIAEKLDNLFAQIETIKKSTERIPELFKNFRRQVLTYAVTGKLTDSDYESWELKTLDEIAVPKAGYAFKATDFIDNGIQVIRMGNLYDNKLSLDRNPVFVPENYDEDIIKRSRVRKNDILITLTGTKYKRDYGYAIKIDSDEILLLNQRILSLTPLINPDYLLLALRSDEFRNQFFEFETGGVNQGNVGVKNVMTIKLHIPSPKVQEEIVQRTRRLFENLDSVERRYKTLYDKLDKLPQALLCRAFKGELL